MSDYKLFMKYLESRHGASPYIDVNPSIFQPIKKAFYRINPFAIPQFSSKDEVNMFIFDGALTYDPQPLPNSEVYTGFLPSHYNAEKDNTPNYSLTGKRPANNGADMFGLKPVELPKVCTRHLDLYKRCKMINGAEKCKSEEDYFLSVCPDFALDIMKLGKIEQAKARMIQRREYMQAMEISSYNKGRNVAQVDGRKRWKDGEHPNLRSDSMWIDDRYADVTQEEIDAAKLRVQKRAHAKIEASKQAATPFMAQA